MSGSEEEPKEFEVIEAESGGSQEPSPSPSASPSARSGDRVCVSCGGKDLRRHGVSGGRSPCWSCYDCGRKQTMTARKRPGEKPLMMRLPGESFNGFQKRRRLEVEERRSRQSRMEQADSRPVEVNGLSGLTMAMRRVLGQERRWDAGALEKNMRDWFERDGDGFMKEYLRLEREVGPSLSGSKASDEVEVGSSVGPVGKASVSAEGKALAGGKTLSEGKGSVEAKLPDPSERSARLIGMMEAQMAKMKGESNGTGH